MWSGTPMTKHYTDEENAQIIIALLKAHGIRKIVASPGTTNIPITGSVQNDPYFEVYSAADERSAAYLACGLTYESGEPVVLSCTGATASRNYLPGLTEAWYRKLPVIAITSC
jgi:2-succinyl-5-enolpyruvyl-6-hydroxy-3-cyclohexene-1-carboxylate synthase